MSEEHIEKLWYRAPDATLTVFFKGGSVCDYSPVSVDDYINIRTADNAAKAVHDIIRKPQIVGINKNMEYR